MQLRPYQSAAVQSIYDYFDQGKGNAPLVVAPTGSGKSLLVASFMQRAIRDYPGTRILLATHQKELIEQDFMTLLRLWPEAPAGIYSAGLGQRKARAQLLFAGVQSVHRKAREIGHVDLMLVDEAHTVPHAGEGQYRNLIGGLLDINPYMKLVGFTATPYRLTSGRLDSGEGRIFDGICYDIPLSMLVQDGYLAPLVSKRPGQVFDLSGLHKRMGDYVESELSARFDDDDVTQEAVKEIVAAGQDRRSWIAFCISVDHAMHVRDAIRAHGIPAEAVTGSTPNGERDRILADFKAGRIRALTNVNVLTTGFDAPQTDLLAFLRPTASLGLYMQMAGRGMRIAPGKADCLVLDFAGNVAKHGPVDAVTPPDDKKKGQGGEAPTKICPECSEIVFAGCRECTACGFLFPETEPALASTSGTEAIMNLTAQEDWREVRDFALARHVNFEGQASMRVEYLIGGKVIKEWVCFEHKGFPRQKAVQWWINNAGTSCPNTVEEALERQAEVRRPTEAIIQREGKYDRIVRTRRMEKREAA